MVSAPSSPKQLATEWFNGVWNQHSREIIHRMASTECLGHHEDGQTRGPADLEAMQARLLGLLPDLQVTIDEVLADDDQNAVVRWTFTGTHTGTVGPLTATGRKVEFSGMTWLKFRDGQIVEGWDRWNQTGLLHALSEP